jgi:NADP-dependent 3-hydroxy acid dehydrogenase YdfG
MITGASSGIGECLALKMAKAGAKKLIISARRVSELDRVKKAC